MLLQLPPEADYPTLQELLEAVQMHASSEGYAIVRRRSKPGYKSGKMVKGAINCERGGHPRRKPEVKRKRTGSIKIGCFFRLNALYKKSLDVWTVEVRHADYNHEEDEVPDASAALQKKNKTADLISAIDLATKAGRYV